MAFLTNGDRATGNPLVSKWICRASWYHIKLSSKLTQGFIIRDKYFNVKIRLFLLVNYFLNIIVKTLAHKEKEGKFH